MEELIPFVFFILWFLFGGLGSKKKREEMKRRAEEQRAAAEAQRAARAEQRRAMRESREADGRITFPEAQTTTAETSSDSLDMIPDELWNILTGGAPRPTQPSRQPSAERQAEDGGWVTSPPYDEEDAVHSIEGISAETGGEDVVDYDDDADRYARARYEDVRATTWEDRPSREAIAVRTVETSETRHDEFHDRLAASEIGRASAAPVVSARERLGLRSLSDVRRAIVLTEILGPPRSQQASFTEGWRGERPPRPRAARKERDAG